MPSRAKFDSGKVYFVVLNGITKLTDYNFDTPNNLAPEWSRAVSASRPRTVAKVRGAANESDLVLIILTGTIIRDDLG